VRPFGLHRLAGIKPIELELPEEVDMKEERRLWEEEELIFQVFTLNLPCPPYYTDTQDT
jgi:hypothetical protein